MNNSSCEFQKEEKFVKTECYHYFHSVCLTNYVEHFLSENHDNKKVRKTVLICLPFLNK